MAQNRYPERQNMTYWIKIAKKCISKIGDLSNINLVKQKVNKSSKKYLTKSWGLSQGISHSLSAPPTPLHSNH